MFVVNPPAVASAASVMGLFSWSNIWIYLLADLAGRAVAALAFRCLNPPVICSATSTPVIWSPRSLTASLPERY
jgi:glycerol uptake facilitator-like aquaporin